MSGALARESAVDALVGEETTVLGAVTCDGPRKIPAFLEPSRGDDVGAREVEDAGEEWRGVSINGSAPAPVIGAIRPAPDTRVSVPAVHSPPHPSCSPRFSATGSPGLRTERLTLEARRAFGGLLPMLDDPELRDVLVQVCDGGGQLWTDRGSRLEQVPGWSVDAHAVHRFARAVIAAGGRHLDELHPCADVRVGDGIRVHAVLPPISVAGAVVSIRLPRATPPVFDELVRGGLCSVEVAAQLHREIAARQNLLITGGTGSGKTTLLAALLSIAPHDERVLTIEDTAELRLSHPHVVALEARLGNAEGAGAVGLDELLRQALRMRPDRIVLGECRGAEVATLLTALNTGHDGGAGTLHASDLTDVPARLEALGALAGLDPRALARQAVSAIHRIVHLARDSSGHRIVGTGRLHLTDAGTLGVLQDTA